MELGTTLQAVAQNALPYMAPTSPVPFNSSWSNISALDTMFNDQNSTNDTTNDFSCEFPQMPNVSEFYYPDRMETWVPISAGEIVKIVFYVIMFVLSVTGNVLVLLVFYHNKNMRSTINQHLVNLAVADLLVATFCMWVHLVRHLTYPNYVLPAFVCKLDGFIQATAVTASVLTLTVISFGRLVVVMFPVQARVSDHRACRVIALVWILSAVVSSPFAIYRELYSLQWLDFKSWHCDEIWPKVLVKDKETGDCVNKRDMQKIFYAVFTIVLYFLPVFFMLINYSLVGWRLWMSRVPGRSCQTVETERRKAVKMVSVVLIVFVLCWTPLQSIILYGHLFRGSETLLPESFKDFEYASYFMAHSNSALNPIIYCGFNVRFRQGLLELLCGRRINGRLHTRRPWTRSWMGGTTRDTTLCHDHIMHDSASRNNRWSTKVSHMYSSVSRNMRSVPQLQQQQHQRQQLYRNDSHCRKASSSSQQSFGCNHYYQNHTSHHPLYTLNSSYPSTLLRDSTSLSNQPELLPPVPEPIPTFEGQFRTPEPLGSPRPLAAGALKNKMIFRVLDLGEPCGCCRGDDGEGGGERKKRKEKGKNRAEGTIRWGGHRRTSCHSIELGTCGTYSPVTDIPSLQSRAEAVC